MQLTDEAVTGATPELRRSAVTLHRALTDFVRQYQFRNRNEICCYGVTVSQCYLLDALATRGPLSMQELAGHLCLKISTVTRLVDGLVKKKLVRRQKDSEAKGNQSQTSSRRGAERCRAGGAESERGAGQVAIHSFRGHRAGPRPWEQPMRIQKRR